MSLYGNKTFYFSLLRKYVIYFGTIFNEIEITRETGDGKVQQFRIPLVYSPKDKMIARYDADPEINRATALAIPRMAFEQKGILYDAERKLHSLGKIVRKDDNNLNNLRRNYNPVPYNIQFELNIISKNVEDSNKIVEQILPFFTPGFTATVNLIPGMGITHDIPVILNSVSWQDNYDGDLRQRRNIIWTLDFTMKAYFYGPTVSKPIIKYANTNFLVGNTSTTNTIVEYFRVTPGLDANGNPTSNSNNSIPVANIAVDTAFGYIVNTSFTANGSN